MVSNQKYVSQVLSNIIILWHPKWVAPKKYLNAKIDCLTDFMFINFLLQMQKLAFCICFAYQTMKNT